jgi:hypothetical protein
MTRGSIPGRATIVARWPLGIAIVSWRYLWRTTALHRSEEPGSPEDLPPGWDQPTELPVGPGAGSGDRPGQQLLAAGSGPMLHRTYAVRIINATLGPTALIRRIETRLNWASPEMAVFSKTRGSEESLRAGDEMVVRMPGPWDGPVRVAHRDDNSFLLVTLDGHLEAGQIEFRAVPDGDALRFEIESWARAGDRLADLLYNRLRLAKEIQLNMWTHFCLRAADLSGGRAQGGVTIRTRWLAWPPPDQPAPAGRAEEAPRPG